MAEYIDIDAPIDVAVYQRNRRIQVTLRQILESNDAKYECSDVVERKRGKWEEIDVANLELAYGGRIYVPEFKCNQCGSYYESYIRWDEPIMPEDADFPKFCPNCGADMRGDKDGV